MDEQKKNENFEIKWQAPEFDYNEKGVSWYWMILIVAIILIAVALWQKNFLFIIFIIIVSLLLFYTSNKFPKIWEFKISQKGISIGDHKFYPYREIESFDVHPYSEHFHELVLKLKARFNPYVRIFIHVEDEHILLERLSKFMQKEEIPYSLVDALERLIKF